MMEVQTALVDKNKLFAAKEEELYYLQQVYENLKRLQHMYCTGKLKDDNRFFSLGVSVNNAVVEVNKVQLELEQLKKDNKNE